MSRRGEIHSPCSVHCDAPAHGRALHHQPPPQTPRPSSECCLTVPGPLALATNQRGALPVLCGFFFFQNKALKCRSNSTAVTLCINSPFKTNVRPVVLSVTCSADLSQRVYFSHLHRATIYKYLLIKLYREVVKPID